MRYESLEVFWGIEEFRKKKFKSTEGWGVEKDQRNEEMHNEPNVRNKKKKVWRNDEFEGSEEHDGCDRFKLKKCEASAKFDDFQDNKTTEKKIQYLMENIKSENLENWRICNILRYWKEEELKNLENILKSWKISGVLKGGRMEKIKDL